MPQAAQASITRRTLFARATPVVATTAIATAGLSLASRPTGDWPEFIARMRELHPNGEKVARKALRAGVDLRDLAYVHTSVGANAPAYYPILAFRQRDGSLRYITASDTAGHEGLV